MNQGGRKYVYIYIYYIYICWEDLHGWNKSLRRFSDKNKQAHPIFPEKRELSYTCTIDKAKLSQLSHIKPIFDIYIYVEREREKDIWYIYIYYICSSSFSIFSADFTGSFSIPRPPTAPCWAPRSWNPPSPAPTEVRHGTVEAKTTSRRREESNGGGAWKCSYIIVINGYITFILGLRTIVYHSYRADIPTYGGLCHFVMVKAICNLNCVSSGLSEDRLADWFTNQSGNG